jgi:hypothetical protein
VPGTVFGTAGGIIANSPVAPVAGTVQGITGTAAGAIGRLPVPGPVSNFPGQVIGTVGGVIPQPFAGVIGPATGGAAAGLPVQPMYGNFPYAVSRPMILTPACMETNT